MKTEILKLKPVWAVCLLLSAFCFSAYAWPPVPAAVTSTNFVSGQFYTNTTGHVLELAATVKLEATNGVNVAAMELWMPGMGTNRVSLEPVASTVTTNMIRINSSLTGFVPVGGAYCFTNQSNSNAVPQISGGMILKHY